jgi:hypothetical protein
MPLDGLVCLAPPRHHGDAGDAVHCRAVHCRDIAARQPEGIDASVRRIDDRHQRQRGAIELHFRAAAKSQPP